MVSSVGGTSASRSSPPSGGGAAQGVSKAGSVGAKSGSAAVGAKAAATAGKPSPTGVAARTAADTTRAKATPATADAARTRVAADPTTRQLEARLSAAPRAATGTAGAAPAATTPKAEVDPKVRAEADKGFEAVKAGVAKADLPDKIGLPSALDDGMQKAWAGSLPGGRSQEQGGVMVQKADGAYEFRAGKPGTAGTFTTNYGDIKPGEKLVASAHTHPYDKTEGGYTNVAFSGTDLANSVYHADSIRTVQSGDRQFASVPSKEFQARVAGLDDAGRTALHGEMKSAYDTAFKSATGDFPARVDAAVRAVARDYGLGYYAGTDGLLQRQ